MSWLSLSRTPLKFFALLGLPIAVFENMASSLLVTLNAMRLFHTQIVDLASLVRNVATTFRETAEAKNLQLVETIADEVPSNMFADGDCLKQAIANLLENAIKFTPEGGRVNIQLDRLDSNIQITISDTGSGLYTDFLPYAFDRFTQAEVPSRHTPGGVGMGLAIARYLVELHYGTIEVASEGEGQGTTFTIRLPFNHPAQPNSDA